MFILFIWEELVFMDHLGSVELSIHNHGKDKIQIFSKIS